MVDVFTVLVLNKNYNGKPRVTHLLFSAAFIYASYLYLVQISLVVFALASRGNGRFTVPSGVSQPEHHVHPPENVSFLLQGHASQHVLSSTTVL
jgi:hypothetical protein